MNKMQTLVMGSVGLNSANYSLQPNFSNARSGAATGRPGTAPLLAFELFCSTHGHS